MPAWFRWLALTRKTALLAACGRDDHPPTVAGVATAHTCHTVLAATASFTRSTR